jgi:hypothetical protein
MKTIKIAMPVLAFLFAIVAAFATDFSKEKSGQVYFRNVGGDIPCETCTPPADIDECEQGPGTMCECLNEPGVQIHIGSEKECFPLSRPN